MSTLKSRRNHSDIDLYDDVEKIKAALLNATHDVKGKASEMFNDSIDDVKDQTYRVKESIEQYTEDKPLKSLGIALAVGVAIGFFLRR